MSMARPAILRAPQGHIQRTKPAREKSGASGRNVFWLPRFAHLAACGLLRTMAEEHPASRRQLSPFRDHAGRDPIDIGDLRAAKAKRIALTRLLLLGSISVPDARQHRACKRRCNQDKQKSFGRNHRHQCPQLNCLRNCGRTRREWQAARLRRPPRAVRHWRISRRASVSTMVRYSASGAPLDFDDSFIARATSSA